MVAMTKDVRCKIISYSVMILMAAVMITSTIVEILAMCNFEFTQTLTDKTMWIKAILWLTTAVAIYFYAKPKEFVLTFAIIFAIIAMGTVVGIYAQHFVNLILLANIIMSIFFSVCIVLAIFNAKKSL